MLKAGFGRVDITPNMGRRNKPYRSRCACRYDEGSYHRLHRSARCCCNRLSHNDKEKKKQKRWCRLKWALPARSERASSSWMKGSSPKRELPKKSSTIPKARDCSHSSEKYYKMGCLKVPPLHKQNSQKKAPLDVRGAVFCLQKTEGIISSAPKHRRNARQGSLLFKGMAKNIEKLLTNRCKYVIL